MEEEIKRFALVWVSAIVSVSYCYYILPRIKAGVPRLLFILPVCLQFFVSPMLFSSWFFIFPIMFFLTGMATLKLMLFAFDLGSLSPRPSSLFQFICFTCFPIKKLEQNPKSQFSFHKWILAAKVAIVGVLFMFHVRGYKYNLPPVLLWGIYPLYMYLPFELGLTLLKSMLTIVLGCDLEPVFDEPYLSTSLQDFWGRRWNPVVSSILRSGIYSPLRGRSKSKSGLSKFIGVSTAFLASGLFHELIFFYTSGHETPSGGVTLFYVLNGVCTATEIVVKRSEFGKRWTVRPVVSWMLTMTFMVVTSGWLYFPQMIRGDQIRQYTKYVFVS
ncbi:unnamed protein product [Brassica oleracea var. botrytis]|uniref:long-chain-alcohol O-fatty-acyltransferase n=7 Tax=Brassica TaxID=3705 RepID=A0A816N1H6_BRANA|nr:hypothetical protein F2Q68_00037349 [Brassica cretica]KAF3484709.1 hypothetical protein F2Q69_00057283 [Brassica cretica]KAF3598214.1 hypothetical protein DY000_02027192 [Brassica cretica]CAF2027460.1 unnamed protein product [Brassica napus]